MVQGKVEICGVNTAKLPLLKQQEKEALFVRIKDGDIEAREEFIKAIDNFDTTLQVKFSTYAVPMIIVWGENC